MIGRTFGKARTALRLARAGLHLAYAAGVAACVYPLIPQAARLHLKRRWSRQLLEMLGVRLRTSAPPGRIAIDAGRLIVANHTSWLDIYVINAVMPSAFVSKADVRAWPLIGWLCIKTDTLFLERGSRSAAQRTCDAIAAMLARGHGVAVFPEGTTSDATTLLRFRPALLQAAIDANCVIQPTALRYTDADGRPNRAAAYCGETTLWQSLCAIAAAPGLAVHVEVLPALSTHGKSRRELAETTHALIGASLLNIGKPLNAESTEDLELSATAATPC